MNKNSLSIFNHLGANQLIAMTGAKNFFTDSDGTFSFQFMKNDAGVCSVRISYDPETQTCDMAFRKKSRKDPSGYITVSEEKGVYLDELRGFFELHTQLWTSMTHRYAPMVKGIKDHYITV